MALRPVTLALRLFDGPEDEMRSRRALTWLMFGLVQLNREFLLAHPDTPSLYESGVVYRPEIGTEIWQDIPTTLALGYGDCEDLASWRGAELQAEGILALPFISWREVDGRTIFHALVRWPDGRIEDPSRALGMNGHPIVRRPVIIGRAVPRSHQQ